MCVCTRVRVHAFLNIKIKPVQSFCYLYVCYLYVCVLLVCMFSGLTIWCSFPWGRLFLHSQNSLVASSSLSSVAASRAPPLRVGMSIGVLVWIMFGRLLDETSWVWFL